jgi:hypothetical protein
MNLRQQIIKAFEHRALPTRLIVYDFAITFEYEEALWFSGRSWQEIRWQDWQEYSCALYAFTPEAFVYYLPSVLSSALDKPDEWLDAVDSLLCLLDRNQEPQNWDDFMTERLVGLEEGEYKVLKDWIFFISESNMYYDEEAMLRCYQTLDLIESETIRIRNSDIHK